MMKSTPNFFLNSNPCDLCSYLTCITGRFSYICMLVELDSVQVCEKKYDSDKNHYKYKVERRITFYPILDLKTESCSKKNLYSNRMEYALGRKDSNLRITGPKPGALPLGHAPFQFLFEINKE